MNFICVKSREEYIKFINDVKENFDCIEDWERFFGFQLKHDEETGELLETIFEYQGDIRCYPDSFPALIYSTFDNTYDRWGELGIRIVDFATFEELGIVIKE